jgi:hypothetical protein
MTNPNPHNAPLQGPRESLRAELLGLLEVLCEGRLSPAGRDRIEQLVLGDRAALALYLEYIDLHGLLHWDTAHWDGETTTEPAPEAVPEATPAAAIVDPTESRRSPAWPRIAALACGITLLVGAVWAWQANIGPNQPVVDADPVAPPDGDRRNGTPDTRPPRTDFRPIVVRGHDDGTQPSRPGGTTDGPAVAQRGSHDDRGPVAPSSTQEIVAFVNREVRAGWNAAGVTPSPRADDAEWVRRVHLDLVGHIPPPFVVEEFLASDDPHKRTKLVDRLLDDAEYVQHFATVWTNLLVGRAPERDVHRESLHRFLRRTFAENRPWSDTLAELIAAEGTPEENGASGFLLAHLNNEAVPATAVTARLFLCRQVQCTQCHKHPFTDADQDEFWQLNSFFKQTQTVSTTVRDRRTGAAVQTEALVSRPVGGPTLYEDRRGVMRAAFPEFAGVTVDADGNVNRRDVLAKLMTRGERPQAARAMVNRMWSHFFGYAFTNPVDDMGPHNPPTHPALLDGLADEFVRSGYDVKQLVRWITTSEAYQLSSRVPDDGSTDEPEAGGVALFSRMYVRPMTVEQLYDSLIVATSADRARGGSWDDLAGRRREWLDQFVMAYDTEENDETTVFSGTIPQALLRMNGELVAQAVSPEGDTYFSDVVRSRAPAPEMVRRLCLAALSREPSREELAAAQKLIRSRLAEPGGTPDEYPPTVEALQDVFWAFLNSTEFMLVH